jgi:hypothetical protein
VITLPVHDYPTRSASGFLMRYVMPRSTPPQLIGPLKNKVVILLSCETARELGPSLIRAGAASYIGWKEDFVWVMDADKATTPWNDEWASPVILPVVGCMNDVLDGKTTGEAFDNMLAGFTQAAVEEDEDIIKSCIIFNKANAVLLGDRNARIRATPKIKVPIPPPPIILPISGE